MNKRPIRSIGYDFVPPEFLPEGKDEYHLRNHQNGNGIQYRNLTAYEIEVLVRNRNTSDDWNKIHVSNAFNPELVKNCKFFGLVRIGKLENIALEYHNITMPVGLYDSTIISCDFGDNVVVSNVNYLSHYIIGTEVIIANVNELHTTNHTKFGNGIIKEGESEDIRIWLEVCNENGGRKILPFNGMLSGDAYLWSKYRDDEALLNRFKELTELKFDKQRGYYGKIGDHCVIKNTAIIKDVWVGRNAYIKGANKLKNLTINSSEEAPTQIGEGCELVNGIIDPGCRVFYGAKAVRFFMASHSQLKYGARLINSFLGDNSTISCCEVLNSLIFPFHEQHHNNSFLIAGTIMGQSNIAAGATLGSNHNSRAADGELVTARGFWPGLCVSLKHNSKFASFTLIAKGDYPAELNIPLPFSLVSNDVTHNKLVVMPAYWFQYNLYALARNAAKYADRDKRTRKCQRIEFDFLAPDSINEIFTALDLLRKFTAHAALPHLKEGPDAAAIREGERLLNDASFDTHALAIYAEGFECANRPAQLVKVKEAYELYQKLIGVYAAEQFIRAIEEQNIASFEEFMDALPTDVSRAAWINVGGQLIPKTTLDELLYNIKAQHICSWSEVHAVYQKCGEAYSRQKLQHAYASLLELLKVEPAEFRRQQFITLLQNALQMKTWMVEKIRASREKDYQNPFRKMVYENDNEMEQVIGHLKDNPFIRQQTEALKVFRVSVQQICQRFEVVTAG